MIRALTGRAGRAPSGNLARLPINFDLHAISAEEGLRAGLSVAVLVAAAYALHAPILLEAGLGALLTCLCDAGGLVHRRIPALVWFGVIGGAMIAGLGLLRPLGAPLIPLACLGIFAFSLVRIYGPSAQQVGSLLCVVLVLSLDRSFHAMRPALTLAGAFVGGSAWALLLTMAIWRLHPNRPVRKAVALVYTALAALCGDLRGLLELREAAAALDWELHARAHRRQVRDTIERARGMVADRLRTGGDSLPAAQSLLRLEAGDQIFRGLIALAELLESRLDPAQRTAAQALTERLGSALRTIAPHIVEGTDAGLAAAGAAVAGLAALARALPETAALRHIADLLIERLRAALNLTGVAVIAPAEPNAGRWLDRIAAPLRANLTWQSAALRHAARSALICAPGFATTFAWPTSYQHWLTITLVLTLQPYYALTLQRALERIGGTVLGGLLAAAIGLLCRTPLSIAAAIFPLSVLALALRGVNFGLYIMALTPVIVLLVELGSPSNGHLTIALMRALYTVLGGTLAVLGCMLLWPSWEPDRLDAELRGAVRAHGAYARLVLALLTGAADAALVDAARRAAGMASNNLEASLSRALLEPRRGAAGRRAQHRLDAAMVVDATLRRMVGHLAALQIDPALWGRADLEAWHAWIGLVADLLGQTLPPPLPARPPAVADDPVLTEALARVARQLDLAAGALRRYGEA